MRSTGTTRSTRFRYSSSRYRNAARIYSAPLTLSLPHHVSERSATSALEPRILLRRHASRIHRWPASASSTSGELTRRRCHRRTPTPWGHRLASTTTGHGTGRRCTAPRYATGINGTNRIRRRTTTVRLRRHRTWIQTRRYATHAGLHATTHARRYATHRRTTEVCLRQSTVRIAVDVTTVRLLQLFQLALGACLRRFLLAHQLLKPAEFWWGWRWGWRWRWICMEASLPVVVTGSPPLVRVRTLG